MENKNMKIVSVEKLVWGIIYNNRFVAVNPKEEKAQLFYIQAIKERNRKAVDINTGKSYSIENEIPYEIFEKYALYNSMKEEYLAGKVFFPFVIESLEYNKDLLGNMFKTITYDKDLPKTEINTSINAQVRTREASVIKDLIVKAQREGGILPVSHVNYLVKLQNKQIEKNLKYDEEKLF